MEYADVFGFAFRGRRAGGAWGIAYPATGPKCCALEVSSNDVLLDVIACNEFDDGAAICDLRAGWCGFLIPDRSEFSMFSEQPTVRCLSSGRLLQTSSFVNLGEVCGPALPKAGEVMSLEQVIRGNGGSGVAALESYQRFIRLAEAQLGDIDKVEFVFELLLGRSSDPGGREEYLSEVSRGVPLYDVAERIWNSVERRQARPDGGRGVFSAELSSYVDLGSVPESFRDDCTNNVALLAAWKESKQI